MLEKEFAGALAVNSELEATKKATAESLLKTTSTVLSRFSLLHCFVFINRFFLPTTKEEVYVFACVRLSVCLCARLFKNACMDLDEMLHVDRCRDMDERINF